MTTRTASPDASASLTLPRTFGARPFHTDGELLALSFAADGSLWSLEEPGVLRGWDPRTRQQHTWHDLSEPATLWCFAPGARFVAAGSDELSLWETASGELQASWPLPSWITTLAVSPMLDWVATGHDDHLIRLWSLAEPGLVRELAGHAGSLSALRFSHDGKRLASAAEDRIICLWDLRKGTQDGQLIGHTDRISALAWFPDGRRLASAGWDTTARIWYLPTCEALMLLNSHAGQVNTLALSADGKLLACADSDCCLHVWDAERYQTLQVLRQPGDVRCLAFRPTDGHLAAGGVDRLIHLCDPRQPVSVESPEDPQTTRTCLALSPDGHFLTSLGAGAPLRFWDTRTGEPAAVLADMPPLRAFATSPDGQWLAASRRAPAGTSGTLTLWDLATGRQEAILEGPAGPITALAFAPSSALLASGSHQSSDVWLWNVPSGEPALLIPGATDRCSVEALAFDPSGRLVAAGGIDWLSSSGADGVVALWDVPARRRVALVPGGTRALAFDPSRSRLAIATLCQSVLLWDFAMGQQVAELTGHLDEVTCVAYSPDGRWLASGGDDRTVRLWDAQGGELRGLVEIDTQVKALAFASDGSLFTGNANTSCSRLTLDELGAGTGR